MRPVVLVLLILVPTIESCTLSPAHPPPTPRWVGLWSAWLDSPGGRLSFDLEIEPSENGWSTSILNGPEQIHIPQTTIEGSTVVFSLPHYDSEITAEINPAGELDGTWSKRRGEEDWTRMKFHARHQPSEPSQADRVALEAASSVILGRWQVQFFSSEDPAVAIFSKAPTSTQRPVVGTFMTTTGDYRFLAGQMDPVRQSLELSCFDGAHAFLFSAKLVDDDRLEGDFWSRDTWHETWVASRNSTARMPDAFTQTTWNESVSLEDLSFPDLDGTPTSLADSRFDGKVRVLQLFGSWCPNCHDAALYLAELHRRYHDRGLSIVGLAFELTDDFERNARLVRKYVERHETPYPVLIAGPADKARATVAFGALDRVRSYPTTIFMDAAGKVHAIHTGFTGPATGESYQQLRQEFEKTIEELLARD